MRAFLLALVALASCRPATNDGETRAVLSHGGEPDNFTSGGFPKHVYPIRNCDFEIGLRAPFEVSEDGWGHANIQAPLELLDDPSVKSVAAGGVDAQSRLSFAFPSQYRGKGMKEWLTTSIVPMQPPRPLGSAETTLGTKETLKGDGTRGEASYLGPLPDGREMALLCMATDWPNPQCEAELPIGSNGQRYLIIFPPKAIGKLTRMVEIGDELFSDAAARCKAR